MQGVADTKAASTSHILSEGKFDAVVHHLEHPDKKVDSHLSHWIKTKKYQLMGLPGLEASQREVDPHLKHWIKTKKYQLMDLPGQEAS